MLRARISLPLSVLLIVTFAMVFVPQAARADGCGTPSIGGTYNTTDVAASSCPGGRGGGGRGVGGGGKSPHEIYQDKVKVAELAWDRYQALMSEYLKCQMGLRNSNLSVGQLESLSCGRPPARPEGPGAPPPDVLAAVFQASPEVAAQIAAARLTVPSPDIHMGPDPSWNEWDKAFVGHPYWLWSSGASSMGTVSDSAGGVSVSLRAELSNLTFKTSSGQTIQCKGAGTPYRRIESNIGKPSPDCGIQFAKVGKDRIVAVAQWTVYWTAAGQSGTLSLVQRDTLDVTIGELHSLNVEPPR